MTPPELLDQSQRYTFVLSLWRESPSAPWRLALRAAMEKRAWALRPSSSWRRSCCA